MPGDGLALAVFVSGQVDLVHRLEQSLQVGHDGLLGGGDDVERFETVVDIDPETGPRFTLVGRRYFVRPPGQVPDVADGGLHDEVRAQHAADGAGLGRRLDDHQGLTHGVPDSRRARSGIGVSLGPVGMVPQG